MAAGGPGGAAGPGRSRGRTRDPPTPPTPRGPFPSSDESGTSKAARCLSGPHSEPPGLEQPLPGRFLRLGGFSGSNSPNTGHDRMTTPALFLERFRSSPVSASLAETSRVRGPEPRGRDGRGRPASRCAQLLALTQPHSGN